jgi:integrase
MIDAKIDKKGRCKFNGPHLTPHSTRHTFGSLSARAGMRPDALQKIIGHANYSVTADIYIHKDVEELKAAMTALKKPDDTSNNTTN